VDQNLLTQKMENKGMKVVEYKVAKGDYLTSVARKYNTVADSLKSWNQLNTEMLTVGQVLKIYVPENYSGAPQNNPPVVQDTKTTNTSNTGTAGANKYYTIRSGDTLWALAQKYGTSVDKLREWNKLYNGKGIQVGMKIIVQKG
jgi:LysM repeat protein